MSVGTLTISKINADQNYISVAIKLEDRTVKANVTLEHFADALFGIAEIPCNTQVRKGKYNGTDHSAAKESQ